MVSMLHDDHLKQVADLVPVLATLRELRPKALGNRRQRAEWIYSRLVRFKYQTLDKPAKGIVVEYLHLMTGCGLRTIKWHIASYKQGKQVCQEYGRNRFSVIYSNADRELLAETDTLHGRLNGKATRQILSSEFLFGDTRYERLARISCAHIYNLRKSRIYREQVQVQGKTQSVQVSIGDEENRNRRASTDTSVSIPSIRETMKTEAKGSIISI